MALAKITLWGMYQWMLEHEDDLFANLSVPDNMDAGTLKDCILYKGAEFGMVYGDPNFVKILIGVWSEKYSHTLERWMQLYDLEYNPIENYDRREDFLDTGSRQRSDNRTVSGRDTKTEDRNETGLHEHGYNDSGSHTETVSHTESGVGSEDVTRAENNTQATTKSESTSNDNGSRSETVGSKLSDKTVENTVSAYDASTYQPDNKTTEGLADAETSSTNISGSGSSSTEGTGNAVSRTDGTDKKSTSDQRTSTDKRTISDDKDSSDSLNTINNSKLSGTNDRSETAAGEEQEANASRHTGRAHGNIGVTSSQELAESEFNLWSKINVYEEAADLFLMEFCVYVY